MTTLATTAVVLAAGKGTRLRSQRPKVLHEVGGAPLLAWVLRAAREAGCERRVVVVGHGAEEVRATFADEPDLVWVEQREQKGTGHALAQAAGAVPAGRLLVLSGDVPLIEAATLSRLTAAAEGAWGAMAVAELAEPGSLGRVLERADGRLERIVEAADASPEELAVATVNAGLYALPSPAIFDDLARLEPANAQGELYLTDAVCAGARREGVALVTLTDADEALGVNSRADLAHVHARLLERHARRLMAAGVTLLRPETITVEPSARVGADTVLHPGVSLLGHTELGEGCLLHAGAWVRNCRLGAGVVVGPHAVLDGVEVPAGTLVPALSARP
jgi:bifunctional UDP-N-acetylglucosamine pyrophosphorylase / glucosamine-1-phosphate N-acetyltransferase